MADNAYLALAGGFTKDQLMTALIHRGIYVLEAGEDPTAVDLQTALLIADADSGNLFLYDSADTTTAHDGTSCQVDQSGRRYKIVGQLQMPRSVLDRTATPPTSTGSGDTYIVTAGATGDWAGQEDKFAVDSAQGWVFVTPPVGTIAYVEDETAFYHYDEGGDWNAGLGSLSITSSAITPVENQFWSDVSVEDILDTPPGSPTNGQVYLVGTSPTGAFASQNDNLAVRRAGAWEFVSPYDGATIWDKDSGAEYRYTSSAWAAVQVAPPAITRVFEYDFAVSGTTSTIDITGLAEYVQIILMFQAMTGGAATSVTVDIHTSTDDGSTFATASNDYDGGPGSVSTAFRAAAANAMNSTPWYDTVRIYGFNASDTRSHFSADQTQLPGVRDAEEINNALRINGTNLNTVTSGRVVVYGIPG